MKKTFAFLLALILTFAVCGCQIAESDVRGAYETDTQTVVSEKPNKTAAVSPETDIEDNEIASEAVTEEESLDDEFSIGTTAGNVYTNDFIGIGCKLDEGWVFYDDTQIREVNQIAADLAGDEYQELIKEASIVYDMYATDSDELNNINVNLEKVSVAQLFALDIAENFKLLAPMLVETYENMGYENVTWEIVDVEIDGKTVPSVHTSAEINDVYVYQTMIQKKCNGYLASLTVTTYFNDTTSDILDNFYWIES